jgi:zinc protease
VAYSACGNLALSQDIAQETFWTAWRQRAALEQPSLLKSWLCGIARNLGKNARRKASRPAESAGGLDAAIEPVTDQPGPEDEAVTREEESMVWKAIEAVPETYREPLILFYREDHSVAEVATALELSEDAVKQRLSRGRALLREQVAGLVEGGLRRSRPGRRFTVGVMAGLAVHAVGAKTSVAAVGGAGGAMKAVAGAGAGLAGSLLGTFGGLLGGWLGTWVPAQAAPTRRERDAILRSGRRMLLVSVVFIAALEGLIYAFAGQLSYVVAWAAWFVAFWAYLAVECVRLNREVKHIRAEPSPDDAPNETALRSGWTAMAARFGDRVYRSEAAFLGLPLIDINIGAPRPPSAGKPAGSSEFDANRHIARGWIAIGEDARGILLAIGGKARGLIALGGRAIGALSFGGLAMGLVAFGGLGLGVVGIGGLGAGVYAFGGAAVGWQSAGGLAVAWDVACGGGALAWRAAFGGAAIAHEYAFGGEAHARHANDQEAKAILLNHPLTKLTLAWAGLQQGNVLGGRAASDRFQLENGLTALARPIQGTENVTLLVLYKIGGDHDPPGRSGLAHLVEHLYVTAAAGTEPARTADAFFQRYRAGCNAQTGDRYTVIATVFPKADLEKELADAAARMADLRVTEAGLDGERPRLREELANMFGRIPSLGAVNNARELIRPAPNEGRKGGLPEQVEAITVDEVRSRCSRYYKPRNAILVLAGALDQEAARRAITTHFARIAAGEEIPRPDEPGQPRFGVLRELTVKPIGPTAEPQACHAYAAPQPGSEPYAPFLVLAARFFDASAQPGGRASPGQVSVYFPILEDPAVLGVSTTVKGGETTPQVAARLEAFVADVLRPKLGDGERTAARQALGFFLGTAELPDFALAQNPYGVALSLARREQLGLDSARLNRALESLIEADLRRAAEAIFAPSRHAGAIIVPTD